MELVVCFDNWRRFTRIQWPEKQKTIRTGWFVFPAPPSGLEPETP